MSESSEQLPVGEAVRRINALAEAEWFDPESAHNEADKILLASVAPEVRAAYESLVEGSPWWATA